MRFKFDDYGWYNGTTDDEDLNRSTDKAPATIPQARVVGEIYPCWGSNEWLLVPYVEPNVVIGPEPEDPRIWWIDVGPFYDRFGPDALAIAASDNGACKAVQTLTGVRKYIDLKDPKISQSIDMLIALSQPTAQPWALGSGPMTVEKKNAILNTPTTEYERHIKGL